MKVATVKKQINLMYTNRFLYEKVDICQSYVKLVPEINDEAVTSVNNNKLQNR